MSIAFALAATLLQASPAPPAPVPAKNPSERICRKASVPTGSRVPAKRECRSALDWASIDAENSRDVDQMRRRTGRQNY